VTAIAAQRMREFVEQGHARPLLAGYFPVPVEMDGRWWHVPTEPPPELGSDAFVPAPAAVAAELARLAVRRRAADQALHPAGGADSP
jgi:hypothetical protein